MRVAQRRDDGVLPLRREDRLEPELGDALLPPRLPDRRRRARAAAERARALGVPGAALVVADPPRAGGEERVAHRVERFARHEDDELAVHRRASLAGNVEHMRSPVAAGSDEGGMMNETLAREAVAGLRS